jgi:drug/metabolite transporter (DMT)-like permease
VSKNPGPVYILLAALFWSLGGVGVKYVPWQALPISCVRSIAAAATIAVMRRQWRIRWTKATVLAALCAFATVTLFMFSNKLTTAANAIVLQYTAPVYVILMTVFVSKKPLRKTDLAAVVVILGGISLFFIDHLGHGMLLGDCLALASGVAFAGVFFFNSLPGANPLDANYLGCVLSALLLPWLWIDPAVREGGAVPWIVAVSMGIFQLGLGYFFFSIGIRRTSGITSSIICTIEPILSPVWVFLVVGERPGVISIVGACIVIVTVCLYNIADARMKVKLNLKASA